MQASPPSLRAFWRQAKADAQRLNNGAEVDVDGARWGLGPRLDRYEAALERFEAILPGDPRRDAALGDLMQANADARRALAGYDGWLRSNPIAIREANAQARGELSSAIANINAAIEGQMQRWKVPEPWRPDPRPVNAADPQDVAQAWEEERKALEDWDPSLADSVSSDDGDRDGPGPER